MLFLIRLLARVAIEELHESLFCPFLVIVLSLSGSETFSVQWWPLKILVWSQIIYNMQAFMDICIDQAYGGGNEKIFMLPPWQDILMAPCLLQMRLSCIDILESPICSVFSSMC